MVYTGASLSYCFYLTVTEFVVLNAWIQKSVCLYTIHNLFINIVIHRYFPKLMACLTNLLAVNCRRLNVLPGPFSDNTIPNRVSRTWWAAGMHKTPDREGLPC